MIVFGLAAVLLLVIACAIFVIPLVNKPKPVPTTSRDSINKAYYNYRLNELDEDEQQGVVAERDELVKELQQNLLVDIPEQSQETIKEKPVSMMVILTGVFLLVAITVFSYVKTGGYEQVEYLQKAEADYPQLREKYNANSLSDAEVRRFALALRARIFDRFENVEDLLILGEMGMRLNSYPIASQAFSHAYRLDPNNPNAQSFYGYLTLMYAQNDSQASFALGLLNKSLEQNPDNLFVIKALAFYALESKDTNMMLYYWNMWLEKLPEDAPNRAMVVSTLEHVKKMAAEQESKAGGE